MCRWSCLWSITYCSSCCTSLNVKSDIQWRSKSFKSVLPKLVWTVTQIKVAIVLLPSVKTFRIPCWKFLFQWSLIIQNNIVVLVPRDPPNNCILPRGVIYPQYGNHWFKCKKRLAETIVFYFGLVILNTFMSWADLSLLQGQVNCSVNIVGNDNGEFL